MKFELVKDRTIGQVLFIVEGAKTEPNLIFRVFCGIFGYQMERIFCSREPGGDAQNTDWAYKVFNKQTDPDSRVIVVNADSSNIKSIQQDNVFLDELFTVLLDDYELDIDNAAIYYLFDRDHKSNTDAPAVRKLLAVLNNARDITSEDMRRQGLLLLSYPCIESFTVMNLLENSIDYCRIKNAQTGHQLKQSLNDDKLMANRINEETLLNCAREFVTGLALAGVDTRSEPLLNSLDDFQENNLTVFDWQENRCWMEKAYGCLSLLCAALLDLGLIQMAEEDGDRT